MEQAALPGIETLAQAEADAYGQIAAMTLDELAELVDMALAQDPEFRAHVEAA